MEFQSLSVRLTTPTFIERSESQIKFQPRQFSKLDENILKLIKKLKVTIPIVYIKGTKYLVGTQHLEISLKNNNVFIGN